MRVALLSTYELGHQPLHVASPSAALQAAGHSVQTLDLAVEDWSSAVIDWAEAVAISVPMHTALRLASAAANRIRSQHAAMPIAVYGLYGAMGDSKHGLFDRSIAGEYEGPLTAWVASLANGNIETGTTVSRSRTSFSVPDRSDLPPLDRYAQLEFGSERKLVGAVEASHGCVHRCRHCPLPTVYDGRIRIVDHNTVLEDIAQIVETGAGHITFADADFFNGPRHSLRIVEELHRRWPDLTYDATIKVEHLIRYDADLATLASTGCLFVVSAFESLNEEILTILDKGHTAGDASSAVHRARACGFELRPTWLPFTPWTKLTDVGDIFAFIAGHDLIGSTDPVQMSIRLLVPPQSLLADHEAFLPHRRSYDRDALTYRWTNPDPAVDELAMRLAGVAEDGTDAHPSETFLAMWRTTLAATGGDVRALDELPQGVPKPRLTEPWFC